MVILNDFMMTLKEFLEEILRDAIRKPPRSPWWFLGDAAREVPKAHYLISNKILFGIATSSLKLFWKLSLYRSWCVSWMFSNNYLRGPVRSRKFKLDPILPLWIPGSDPELMCILVRVFGSSLNWMSETDASLLVRWLARWRKTTGCSDRDSSSNRV